MSTDAERTDDKVDGYHDRNELPHLKRAGAAYFVTFRLAGTLPVRIIADLKAERARIIENSRGRHRPMSWHEQGRLFDWYSRQVDGLLDSGLGHCWLAKPEIAQLVANSIRHFEGDRYDLSSWVLMPNHVHVVVRPREGYSLSQILHSWKGYSALQANRLLGRVGESFWQRESYDHVIREGEEMVRFNAYVEWNPVKAGLCGAPEEWKWSSAYGRSSEGAGGRGCLPERG